ncbi:hypothetical protein QJS10_CPB20g00040 [Acorus calamus]|uniref:Cytochrome P450 n=1 Tax=Acorus calamus TaxID=4465 RepID=A0AAV9CAZ8_ACOCL|nr:hypothetical protein QJS10_CPB20g00040 [Acorus calamus]
MEILLRVLVAMFWVGLCSMAYKIYDDMWWRPRRIREEMGKQGIGGPEPGFLYGNIAEMRRISSEEEEKKMKGDVGGHVDGDYAATLFPYFERWRRDYGRMFIYATGNLQTLYVTDPNLVKEISLCKSLDFGKPLYLQKERGPLLGQGIFTSNGEVWAHQRKVIAPEFLMNKVKGMVDIMVESTIPLLKAWESKIVGEGGIANISVDEDVRHLSADVISKVCFGSSYARGEEIFSKLRALQQALSKPSILIGIPGSRCLPTKNNREIWRLEREIGKLILKVVKARKHEINDKTERDFLRSIIENADDRFIVDNCKNIYFAGHETIATSASWALMLLASHPEWQKRARDEVVEFCGVAGFPNSESIRKMKTLTMVIQETLRLYPPAAFVVREALQDMNLGTNLRIPRGLHIKIPISTAHRDGHAWGPDANRFDPGRFARGVSGACRLPHMYMPFGTGERACVGQNLAVAELKVVLATLLSRFEFSLSPEYRHSPAFRLTIEPQFGVLLHVKKV